MEIASESSSTASFASDIRAKASNNQKVQRILDGVGQHQQNPQPPLNAKGKYLNVSA